MVTVVVTPELVGVAGRDDNELAAAGAAVTVTDSVVVAVPAVPVKVLPVVPADTVTVEGTVRLALELVTDAAKPPLGAALERATVHVVDDPEATDEGEQASEVMATGATSVKVVVLDVAFNVAVRTDDESTAIVPTVAENEAVV